MFAKRKLKKMGYEKEDFDNMTIENILKLGDMGYTKEEIDALQKEPENDVNAQINSLKEQIEKLTNATQIANTRESVENVDDIESEVDKALNMLAGGSPNGRNETS